MALRAVYSCRNLPNLTCSVYLQTCYTEGGGSRFRLKIGIFILEQAALQPKNSNVPNIYYIRNLSLTSEYANIYTYDGDLFRLLTLMHNSFIN
jgi:hypothetical protein